MQDYAIVIQKVFQAASVKSSKGLIILLTSANQGEGVTSISKTLAAEIAVNTGKQTLVVGALALKNITAAEEKKIPLILGETNHQNLRVLYTEHKNDSESTFTTNGSSLELDLTIEQLVSSLDYVRSAFECTLIDCPPLAVSSVSAILAPLVDGVVLVVRAGVSKRDQINYTQRMMETAPSKILGYVLNGRDYPVPDWLYKRL